MKNYHDLNPAEKLLFGIIMSFLAAFWLMLLAGAAHGWDHVIPTLGYWQSWLGAFLYGSFHNTAAFNEGMVKEH